jgi:hypothetical protein
VAAQDVERVLRNGGQVCVDPTDLAQAFPCGGTGLGVIGDVVLKVAYVTDEALGADDRHAHESVETLYLGESWLMALSLRQWDNDPINAFVQNRIAGATRTVITDQYRGVAGSRRPGTRLTTSAKKVLFVPNDPRMPSVLFYKGVLCLEETQELRLTATEELKMAVVIRAMYHQSLGAIFKMGLLSELTLT